MQQRNAQYVYKTITYPYNWTALLASAINRNTEGGVIQRHKKHIHFFIHY